VKQQNKHIDLSGVEEQSKRFLAGGKFDWSKSNTSVWEELDTFIIQSPARKVKYDFRIIQWSVAAIFVLLLGISGFFRFYTKTITTQAGSHFAMSLPDGSKVNLNAQSTLTYHPYWWRFDRKVTFEGEGYFVVEKGKRFRVISTLGTTQVVGTSFNIFSRDEVYRVTCISGSVKVISKSKTEVILKPCSKANVSPEGQIKLVQDIETLPEISWKDNMFLFTAVPVRVVFSEIERQYGISIEARINNYTLYTGNFSKNQKVEEVLGYICPALGYKFIHKSEKVYTIIPDEQ
jgi:ferric-dicitrate binding protein FerR (iron transport regulator)